MFNRPGFSALNTDICWAEYERVKEFLPVRAHVNVGTIGRVTFSGTPLNTCIKAALGTLPEPQPFEREAILP
ncbi:hypothetical protein MLDJOKPK_00247 [Salmonella phage SPAsTU]|nr:hypothetical protein STsAS_164 [Salmonella phage STsAS]AWN09146.1 hypothetical protein MLDJOKPK_00247 [Salmonella phage SPAsTU]